MKKTSTLHSAPFVFIKKGLLVNTVFLLLFNGIPFPGLLPFVGNHWGGAFAQDIHYSQFDASPLTLNPALTGVMDLNFRVTNNYKNQWSSVAPPYSTLSFAYDMNILKNRGKSTYLGAGLSALNDKAGKSQLTNTQFNLSIAATQILNDNNTLSVGLQGGYAQKSIDFSKLSWDNQFNGNNFDPALPAREINYSEKKNYIDVSAGGLWNFQKSDAFKLSSGVAYFHANKPDKSFNNNVKEPLQPKLVLHNRTEIKLRHSDNFPDRYIVPKILFMKQGAHEELFFGAFMKLVVQTASRYTNWRNEVTFDLGAFYRKGDAVIAATSFDYGNIRMGISYDINISKLKTASAYNGGIEFSLIYTGIFNTEKIKVKGLPRME